MITNKYSKETIDKAFDLFKAGFSYERIAKEVGVKRLMTIFDWAKKFGWSRKPVPLPDNANEALQMLQKSWIALGKNTADTLLKKKDISTTEGIKILHEVTALMRHLTIDPQQTKQIPDSPPTEEKKPEKAKVLRVLDYETDRAHK